MIPNQAPPKCLNCERDLRSADTPNYYYCDTCEAIWLLDSNTNVLRRV